MRRTGHGALGVLVVLLLPAFATAAPPKVQVFEQVEKGFEVGAHLGGAYDFMPPVDQPGPGLLAGIEVGYDLTWILRVKLGFDTAFYSGEGPARNGDDTLKRNFEHRVIWGGASLSLLATERLYAYIQAGVGYQFTTPKDVAGVAVAGDDDLALLAGGGLEYYTQLRHFSFGIEANATILPIRGDVALAIYPVVRFTFGGGDVREIKPPKDRDGDGVPDEVDKCPDSYGVESQRGCPEPDTDGDGVIDREDACPQEPGPVANAGCPLNPDTDGDGLPDKVDRCPTQPGPESNGGCPEEDSDEDGIPDKIDLCPTKKGKKEYDGCPKKSDVKIKIRQESIELREKIHFETNKAIIKRESHPLLDQVASTLTQYPEIRKLQIEGHTDWVGSDEYNRDLSQRRAEAVVDYLAHKGIDRGRLVAKGFGEEKPIADNKTAAGRAMNRRVEMIILERD